MNEKEKLYEQYEDAFFAILMAEVAEAEGEKLLKLNESLLSDPNAAVPGTTSKRCLNIIKKNYKKDLRKKTLKHISYASVCRGTRLRIKRQPGFWRILRKKAGKTRKENAPSISIWPASSDSWQQT